MDTAATDVYTLSLHDALPISRDGGVHGRQQPRREREVDERRLQSRRAEPAREPAAAQLGAGAPDEQQLVARGLDRKSTRLNSSHLGISYAVFCLKKKKTNTNT